MSELHRHLVGPAWQRPERVALARSCAAASLAAALVLGSPGFAPAAQPKPRSADAETVSDEHALIGVGAAKASPHTEHPDAQWFPEAGLGLFIHWGISSVKAMNISWPM